MVAASPVMLAEVGSDSTLARRLALVAASPLVASATSLANVLQGLPTFFCRLMTMLPMVALAVPVRVREREEAG